MNVWTCCSDCACLTSDLRSGTVVLTHMSSSCVFQYLEYCDNIVVLEDGEVREAGDHEALLKADGRYAQFISNYQMDHSNVKEQHMQYKPDRNCSSAVLNMWII